MNIKKYWKISTMNMEFHLAYRFRFFIWMFVTMSQMIVFPFIWLAIYGTRTDIAGYTKPDIVTYYIVTAMVIMISRSFLVRFIQRDIMKGELSMYLLRPSAYLLHYRFKNIGYKILSASFALIIFGVLAIFLPKYIVLPRSFLAIIFFGVFLFFAWIISSSIQHILGLCTFWLGETNAVVQMKDAVDKIFSGELAPLAFFPVVLQSIAHVLPFQYISYVPVQVFLGHITGAELWYHLFIALCWTTALHIVEIVVWKLGLKKYEGASV